MKAGQNSQSPSRVLKFSKHKSSDFFGFGDDEVNQEKSNKNKEILNLLSESDFEQIKNAIELDLQKGNKEQTKISQKRAFSS